MPSSSCLPSVGLCMHVCGCGVGGLASCRRQAVCRRYVCTYVYIYMCVCACVYVCVYIYVCVSRVFVGAAS